ncbi:hypothetical protein RchiOBHm_Chr7g0185641 [Rosa chinensis]|uniref:Uncharacterized protein n=1 Tax=Rosa chinensis TaxID=74649 RepID=A0A2P6P3R6_ROSCH|nr:uncharacterized protein LOC112176012 isoform X1 [Rosa chinensis]PRQ16568.1 hypothetical protein RchiOBHm_Chr7g0185641 [Rosa chinensis]
MANGIESSCTDIVKEDHGFRVILEGLENTMTAKFRKNSLWSGKSCIFRVPEVLRRHKPEAYRPDVVSIGPFHRGGKKFRPIEDVKRWYLQNLLSRMNISLKTLMEGIDNIIEFEKRAREFYSEPPHLSRDDFIEMLILDGCFIVELFWKYFCWSFMHFLKTDLVPAEELNIDNDPIINKDCMIQYIYHDLLLLENQVPWFVLECLYNLTLDKYFPFPLKRIVLASFCKQESLSCMLQFYLSHRQDDDDHDYDAVSGDADDFDGEILHILDLVRTATTFRFKNKPIPGSKVKLSPATTLSESGIKFRKSTDSGIIPSFLHDFLSWLGGFS